MWVYISISIIIIHYLSISMCTHTHANTHTCIYINTHMHGLRTFTNHFPSGFRSKIPPSAVSSQSWAPRIHQELLLPFGHPLLWATKQHAEMDTETPFSGKNLNGMGRFGIPLILSCSHSPVACNGGGYPFVDQHTRQRTFNEGIFGKP
jgi:hypothetical protein